MRHPVAGRSSTRSWGPAVTGCCNGGSDRVIADRRGRSGPVAALAAARFVRADPRRMHGAVFDPRPENAHRLLTAPQRRHGRAGNTTWWVRRGVLGPYPGGASQFRGAALALAGMCYLVPITVRPSATAGVRDSPVGGPAAGSAQWRAQTQRRNGNQMTSGSPRGRTPWSSCFPTGARVGGFPSGPQRRP